MAAKNDREQKKEKRLKKKQKLNDEFKDLYKSFKYDENGNKLTKAQQNQLIIEKLGNKEKLVESCVGAEAVERQVKWKYKVVVGKVFCKELNREIKQIIESDC